MTKSNFILTVFVFLLFFSCRTNTAVVDQEPKPAEKSLAQLIIDSWEEGAINYYDSQIEVSNVFSPPADFLAAFLVPNPADNTGFLPRFPLPAKVYYDCKISLITWKSKYVNTEQDPRHYIAALRLMLGLSNDTFSVEVNRQNLSDITVEINWRENAPQNSQLRGKILALNYLGLIDIAYIETKTGIVLDRRQIRYTKIYRGRIPNETGKFISWEYF